MIGFEWAYYSIKDNGMLSNKDVEVFVLRCSTRWLWWAWSLMPRAASLSAASWSDINFYVKLTGVLREAQLCDACAPRRTLPPLSQLH
jgi:hypothetical protein